MYIPFDNLPDSSRLWIYQADTQLNSEQHDILFDGLQAFTEKWEVHGQPMHASFKLVDDYFIILAADEGVHATSGCSIDNAVRIVGDLGRTIRVNFFNRNNIAFRVNDQVKLVDLSTLKKKLAAGEWDGESLVYNNLVQQKSALTNEWIIPAYASWLKRYLPQGSLSS